MPIDLHTHTTASDGLSSPADLVRLAGEAGIDTIAVTDHDTLDGVATASAAGRRLGVRVIPGIELSTGGGGVHVHVLGLFLDPHAPALSVHLEEMRRERHDRGRRIVGVLNDLGYAIRFEDVLRQAGDAVVARPHIARALVAAGLLPDVASAFSPGLMGDGGPGDVPRRIPSPEEAVALVRGSGGTAVLAHPGIAKGRGRDALLVVDPGRIEALARAGLAGLEVDHPFHTPLVRERLLELCGRLGLVPTGGSDFHGAGAGNGSWIGSCTTSESALARLERAAAEADT